MQKLPHLLLRYSLLCASLVWLGACSSNQAAPVTGEADGGGSDTGQGVPAADLGQVDAGAPEVALGPAVAWRNINRQPAAWYATPLALQIASNVLYYQNTDGGWPKDTDMTTRTAPKGRSSIDNSATTTQMIFLGKVYAATTDVLYKDAFIKALDFLFAGQYANGGWPQEFPPPRGYQAHITFNDGAMIHVLELLREIGLKAPQYAFVDEERAARSLVAVDKGIDCILKCQIVVEGQKTGWCAQHDSVTLAPAMARPYELASISGQEGAGVLEFLMTISAPTPEVIDAVQSATRWFKAVQLSGIKVMRVTDATQPSGIDEVVVQDPLAPPLWARFYEIGTNLPIFADRDGVKKYSLAEIGNERRTGYSWYTDNPSEAFEAYAAWQPQFAPTENVLAP
jgi:PelA/Pel-15E family pectate lyase